MSVEINLAGPLINFFPHIVNCDPKEGGAISLLLGMSGSGKTGWEIHAIRRKFERKEDERRLLREKLGDYSNPLRPENEYYHTWLASREKIFWLSDPDCQWTRLPKHVAKSRVFVHKKLYGKIKFFKEGEPTEMMEIPFDSFQDLMSTADPDMLNVAYFPKRIDTLKFLKFLMDRASPDWVTIVIDEMERIAPYHIGAGAIINRYMRVLADSLVSTRKQRTCMILGCHIQGNLHWLLKKMVNYHVFTPGAMAIEESRINQDAIDALDRGQFRIGHGGKFDNPVKAFPDYPESEHIRARIVKEDGTQVLPEIEELPSPKEQTDQPKLGERGVLGKMRGPRRRAFYPPPVET